MKIRLGIVGPKDSVDMIDQVAQQFPEYVTTSFYYEHTEETGDIVSVYEDRIDLWLFSGQAPYAYAIQQRFVTEDQAFFPPLHGSSLLGTLLEVLHTHEQPYLFTLDTIDTEEMEEVIEAHGLKKISFQSYPYMGYKSAEEIIAFHRSAYEENPETIALTCIRAVYNELQELGQPVYRITASRFDIKETLKYLRERTSATWYRNHQLAIAGVEIREAVTSPEEYYSFRRKHKELELKRLLLQYTEEVKGSLMQMGDGMYFIFSTRGEVESHPLPFSLMEEARVQTKLAVRIALGYGKSVMEAEEHVHQALRQVRQSAGTLIVTVNENNESTEHFNEEDSLSYAAQRKSTDWYAAKVKGKISPGVVAKIFSYAAYHQQQEVTSRDIAKWLTSSERNARRILHELEKAELAEVVGEEQEVRRGRPRRMFSLKL